MNLEWNSLRARFSFGPLTALLFIARIRLEFCTVGAVAGVGFFVSGLPVVMIGH